MASIGPSPVRRPSSRQRFPALAPAGHRRADLAKLRIELLAVRLRERLGSETLHRTAHQLEALGVLEGPRVAGAAVALGERLRQLEQHLPGVMAERCHERIFIVVLDELLKLLGGAGGIGIGIGEAAAQAGPCLQEAILRDVLAVGEAVGQFVKLAGGAAVFALVQLGPRLGEAIAFRLSRDLEEIPTNAAQDAENTEHQNGADKAGAAIRLSRDMGFLFRPLRSSVGAASHRRCLPRARRQFARLIRRLGDKRGHRLHRGRGGRRRFIGRLARRRNLLGIGPFAPRRGGRRRRGGWLGPGLEITHRRRGLVPERRRLRRSRFRRRGEGRRAARVARLLPNRRRSLPPVALGWLGRGGFGRHQRQHVRDVLRPRAARVGRRLPLRRKHGHHVADRSRLLPVFRRCAHPRHLQARGGILRDRQVRRDREDLPAHRIGAADRLAAQRGLHLVARLTERAVGGDMHDRVPHTVEITRRLSYAMDAPGGNLI